MIAFNQSKRVAPRFAPGALVVHKRYGYHGVVVAADGSCKAPEAWCRKNKTQPDKLQPWYHVFVHNSSTVTYAAEENLEEDRSGIEVNHPLVEKFFSRLEGGAYARNEEVWPGW